LPEKTRLGIIDHFEKSTVDVEVKGFDVLAAGNGDVEFIKQKVERNFANIFSNAGLTVRSDFTANQSPSGARFTISGKISYKSEGDILLSVLLQDANNNDVGSAYIGGPANEIKTLYKVVPSALMSAMDVDFSTLKKLKSHNQPTNSVLAYAYFLQARTEAYEKNFDAAVKYLQRAKEIDPKFAMAYWGIGEVRRLEGNDIEANIWYKKASDIDPDRPKMDIIAGNEMHLVPISLAKRSEERPLPGASYAQLNYSDYGVKVHIWTFDSNDFDARAQANSPDNLGGQVAPEFLVRQNDILAVNGGFFDIFRNAQARNTLTPKGLIIADGHEISGLDQKGGSGVLFMKNSSIGIIERAEFDRNMVSNALQAGPILVENGGKIGIYKNDFNRQNRTAVCLRHRMLIVVVVEGGVSLFELAQLLSTKLENGGLECQSAINFDGGPSTQFSFRGGGKEVSMTGRWRIQNGLVIHKRT